jgi:alkylated DNA repair dioxygenase AlkB
MQRSLFATDEPRTIKTDGAEVRYVVGWLPQSDADRLLVEPRGLPGWRQDHIRIYGKTHPLPRLHRWFADSGHRYHWSGIEMHPELFPPFLRPLLHRLHTESGFAFNTALGNLYRDGNDGVIIAPRPCSDCSSDLLATSLTTRSTCSTVDFAIFRE